VQKRKNITAIFPKHLFWDVDMGKLDIHQDKDLIIPRALYMTTAESFASDIVKLENLYTHDQIVQELKATKEKISNEVCKLVAERYALPLFSRFPKKV
jgi:hypothetical protein